MNLKGEIFEETKQLLTSDCKEKPVSEAYPPEKRPDQKFIARCHKLIKNNHIKINPKLVKYLLYKKGEYVEMDEIKALHKEWFPVDYSDNYFKNIRSGQYNLILALYEFPRKDFTGTKKQK